MVAVTSACVIENCKATGHIKNRFGSLKGIIMNSSRRKFIGRYLFFSSILTALNVAWQGCDQKKGDSKEAKTSATIDACDDFTGVSEDDLKARRKLGYVNESPIAEMTCNKCKLWLPPTSGKACGGCMLFKGPVFPGGYCTYWSAAEA